MRFGRIRLTVAFLVGLVISTPSCGLVQREPEAGTAPALLRLSVLPYVSYAPLYIGAEEGYYAEQSLRVEFVPFGKISMAIAGLADGSVDAHAGMVSVGLLNAIERGSRIRIVASKGHFETGSCPYMAVVARKGLIGSDSPLSTRTSLKKCTAALGFVYYHDFQLERSLAFLELQPADVTIRRLLPASRFEALDKGSFDLAVEAEPLLSRMLREKGASILQPIQDVLPGTDFAFLAYGPSLIDENEDLGRRFMAAYLKSVEQYNQGKTGRNLGIMAKVTGLEAEFLKDICWPPIRSDGRIDPAGLMEFQRWARDRGLLNRVLSEGEFWDPRFIDSVGPVPEGPEE